MLPDFDSLRCFDAAARHLNFRLAAQAVHLSPTAFSERIRRLEDALGGQLFERTTRKVALTRRGLSLVPQARRCLEEARRCELVVSESNAPLPFELIVGTRFELGLSWLVPSLSTLERGRPERTLHLFFGDSPDLIQRIERGAIDAAITSARFSNASLKFLALHEERYAFVGATKLLAKIPLRRSGDAARHVLFDAHADLPLFRYFRDASPSEEVWAFKRVQRLGGIGAIRFRVLEGIGVAVLPRYLIESDLKKGTLREIAPKIRPQSDHFRLIWREGHALEPALSDLAADLRALPLR